MATTGELPRRTWRVALVLTVVVGALATLIAYLGTREGRQAPEAAESPQRERPAPTSRSGFPTVLRIALPHEDPPLPSGPHQRTFVASCTICHSTTLVLGQPPFPRAKWTEIVQKMTKAFGAPMTPAQEGQVVEYLVSVRGK